MCRECGAGAALRSGSSEYLHPAPGPGKSLRESGTAATGPSALPRSSEPSGLLPWGSGSDLSCSFLVLVILGRRKILSKGLLPWPSAPCIYSAFIGLLVGARHCAK